MALSRAEWDMRSLSKSHKYSLHVKEYWRRKNPASLTRFIKKERKTTVTYITIFNACNWNRIACPMPTSGTRKHAHCIQPKLKSLPQCQSWNWEVYACLVHTDDSVHPWSLICLRSPFCCNSFPVQDGQNGTFSTHKQAMDASGINSGVFIGHSVYLHMRDRWIECSFLEFLTVLYYSICQVLL